MIKRTGVRKMACVSFLVIFCVCFLVTGTARAAEPNTVSRGEWIQRLVSTFQMTVEDHTTMPDNYFSDLSSEDTYYSDILTAVEFGVIDLEAGEPFQPDSPATREFAAQTLNFCLGFQIDEETYTYIDSNETAYPEDAQVAINRGWFVLVNGAFCPDQPITPSEMQGMLADAQSVLTSDATGEIQSDFTVAEGVIVIPETAQVSVDMEDTLTIVGYEGTIHTGDVFVVTFGGFPVAYQAGNVQEENGTLVIQGLTGEATENAISEAHISGTSEADLGNFEPAEETTYYITDQNKGANAPVETLRIAPRGIEYDKGAKTLTIIEDVKLNQATAGSLTVVMSNIETDHDVDGTLIFVTSAHFSLESDLSVTASIRFDLSSYAGIPSSLPLGGINLGVAKLTLAMNYDLSGGIAANWTGSLSAGISYRAGDGVRIIKNFQKDVFSMVADVELRVGVRALAEFNLIELVKGSAWAGVGVQGNASYTYYDTGTPETCETISGYLYAEVGYSARILWDSYGDTVVLYNERNSPVRVYYHYENGVMVDHCSRDSSSYPYYTGVNSPYFNPGPGHASGSYELGGVVRATFTYEVKTDNETGKQYASITGYTGNPSVLVIPSEIDGYSVQMISSQAFEGKTSLRAVTIPDSVTEIGSSAFADCTNLQNVELSKGLVSLDSNAFNGCVSLLEIEIPKSLTQVSLGGTSSSLTNGVFGGSGLTTVRFEQGMTRVPEYLFRNATHLQNVEFLDTMTTIESGAFVRCTSLTEVDLPESLTSIEGTVFEGCTGLTAIDIPDTVTSIGSSAFADCTNLQDVQLPKGLVSLDGNVFNGCISLLEIEIPKSLASVFLGGTSDSLTNGVFGRSGLTTVRFEQGMTKVPEYLFMNATHLQNVEFLDTMTTIESGAFVRCTSLTEVDLPESLIRIEGTAFEGCTGLTAIDIPDTVTAIGIHAFEDCTNLKDVHLPKNLATLSSYLFRGCSAMQVIELPPTLEEIEDAAFENSGMVSIEIPGNCATLGNDVFADCVSLKEAVLEPGVKSIGNNCFDGCTALETVSLPEGLTTIRDFAFRNCDALTAVEVPDSVTTLETYAFSSCDSLSDVSLGTGITEIPQYAFYGCPSLQKVTIPYRVTEISGYAFANCTGLTEITIPQSVTTIASTAFSYPDKLTIYGVAGSYAETYANDHSIKFVSRTVPATSVSLNTEELTINRGSTAQLVVNVQPEDFTDSVSWKSANTAVATVTDAGVVKAVSVGSTTIRVVVGNISVDCVVTVVQPVTSISLNRTSLTLEAASSFQLVATANPSTAQNREVTWSSSDTSIASVNENGLVTAHKKGTATITAKAVGSNVSRSCTVTVPNNAHVASSVTELESPHPYEDSCSDVWVYTVKDATYLEFTFHESTDIESGFDYLYLYNAAGEEVGRYTGKALAGQTIRIEGNTVKIKLVSDASGSAWGFQVTGLDTDGTVNPYESLLAQMEQLSELTDIDAILSGVKELEQNELTEAMEDQENGTAVLDALTELERATQIETAITVTDEMNTTFKEGDIQVLGAALNIAEVNQGQTNTVTLVVDSAGSDHALSDQYKNGLAFSMHLDNASASLSVPVQIKLPVPSSLESDNLVLFHYKADGSTETVDFTLSQENGQAYATFVLTEFSDFQFANLDYILGDVTGDGRVNGLDVNRLFRYVNGQISLNPQQLASADVTGDSRVNGLDVNRLFRYVNGQITEL